MGQEIPADAPAFGWIVPKAEKNLVPLVESMSVQGEEGRGLYAAVHFPQQVSECVEEQSLPDDCFILVKFPLNESDS